MSTPSLAAEAREAVLFTLPLYEMARMRAATSPRKHPALGFAGADATSMLRWMNQFTHTRRLLGPQDREVVTPNNDTLYTNAWLDLAAGPVLIEVPDMDQRYWTLGFLDLWSNPFAYAGRRTTGNAAQRLFVHGPDWQGQAADGAIEIAAPGNDIWIIGRILVDDRADDLAAVRALQQRFVIRRTDGQDAASRLDVAMDGRKTTTPALAEYRHIVATALARNPAPAGHAKQVRNAAQFGLAAEGTAAAVATTDAALQDALASVCTELRDTAQPSELGGGWSLPVLVRTNYGEDFLTRARVARNMIGALGIEEAMYVVAEVDADGAALDGRDRYELRFSAGQAPQVDAFWSLTMYRKSDCLLVDNALDRYSIGDRTAGLHWDEDGALRIRIQASDPGPGCNWLPAPAEPFYLTLRLYQPREEHTDLRFRYPPLRRLS